jgi:hypothetical protein
MVYSSHVAGRVESVDKPRLRPKAVYAGSHLALSVAISATEKSLLW